jgi:hypothetical protein
MIVSEGWVGNGTIDVPCVQQLISKVSFLVQPLAAMLVIDNNSNRL